MIKKTALLLLALLAMAPLAASIQTIHSIEEVSEELERADADTLVIFDVDETLTHNFDTGLFFDYDLKDIPEQDKAWAKESQTAVWDRANRIGKDRGAAMAISFRMLNTKGQFVEDCTPEIIHQLQARHVPVIALTACPAGPFGFAPCGRTLRYSNLLAHRIDFSSAFKQNQIIFDALPGQNNQYPMFYKGILFSGLTIGKGCVLGAFLDHIGMVPKKVLFFDDSQHHVENVGHEMELRGIPYQGYWYQAIHQCQRPPFNRMVAEVQFHHLIHYDTLLTATQAASMIEEASVLSP